VAHIEHIAIWCNDIETLTEFYVTHFGATAGPPHHNPRRGFRSRFLELDGGARLELMMLEQGVGPANASAVPAAGFAHIAFGLGSEAAVDAATERLRVAGRPVIDGPRRTGDGYYESVLLDPEGNRLELTV
jgi:lactoylglutathione lyase